MADPFFEPVQEDVDVEAHFADYENLICHCRLEEVPLWMEIEEGQVILTCVSCGKVVDLEYVTDLDNSSLYMDGIKVRFKVRKEAHYYDYYGAIETDVYFDLEPMND